MLEFVLTQILGPPEIGGRSRASENKCICETLEQKFSSFLLKTVNSIYTCNLISETN